MDRIISFIVVTFIINLLFPLSALAERAPMVYVSSSSGDDNNSGLTENDPVATLFRASQVGTDIYLKAGDVFYGNMLVRNRKVMRYGNGKNPVISGFRRLEGRNWVAIGDNLWRINLTQCKTSGMWIPKGSSMLNNVGCLHEYDTDEIHGRKVRYKEDLKEAWDIWQTERHDKGLKPEDFDVLYLYLDKDPNDLCLEYSIAATGLTVYDGTIDGITLKGFGIHGISGHSNTVIRNCVIDAIGGELFVGYKDFVCLGNGIEFCVTENIEDCLVENCLIRRCYDCGASIQGAGFGRATPRNIVVRNNLIMNCCQGWEDYLCNDDDVKYENCRFEGNVVVDCGNTTGFGYLPGRVKFCNILGTNTSGDKGMIVSKNTFIGGNLYCSTSYNSVFQSNEWIKNRFYTTRSNWLLKEAAYQSITLTIPATRTRESSLRRSTNIIIKQYRQLTGDTSTRIFIESETKNKLRMNKAVANFIKNNKAQAL